MAGRNSPSKCHLFTVEAAAVLNIDIKNGAPPALPLDARPLVE
jgi:hypothetical protein